MRASARNGEPIKNAANADVDANANANKFIIVYKRELTTLFVCVYFESLREPQHFCGS